MVYASVLRSKGLLLLIDHICRKITPTGLIVSADLARSFVSKATKKKSIPRTRY